MAELEASRQILDLIPKIMHQLRSEMRSYAKGQLTIPQFRILIRITKGMQTHREVAEWMGVAPATLTRMVDSLVARKLASRSKDPLDGRQIHLQATPQGKQLAERYKDQVNLLIQARIQALSPAQKVKLKEGLRVLTLLFAE